MSFPTLPQTLSIVKDFKHKQLKGKLIALVHFFNDFITIKDLKSLLSVRMDKLLQAVGSFTQFRYVLEGNIIVLCKFNRHNIHARFFQNGRFEILQKIVKAAKIETFVPSIEDDTEYENELEKELDDLDDSFFDMED